jgi:hypothetical protein
MRWKVLRTLSLASQLLQSMHNLVGAGLLANDREAVACDLADVIYKNRFVEPR